MSKSLVSLLVGQAIARGKLRESDRLVDLLPELKTGGDYDKVTVRDLLDMRSENYRPYWPFTGAARMYLTRDLPGFIARNREMEFTPGSATAYRSVDTQLLGMALTRATGSNLADLLARDIWQPIGAERPASWNLDRAGGTEKAFCCVNATARDFARVGQMLADQGYVAGRQVVPGAWVARIAAPVTTPLDGWGYSAQWWHRAPMTARTIPPWAFTASTPTCIPAGAWSSSSSAIMAPSRTSAAPTTWGDRPALARRASRLGDAQPGSPSYRWAITSCLRNSKPRCGQVPTYSARACCPAG